MKKQPVHIKTPGNDTMCGSLSSYWVSDHHKGLIEDFNDSYGINNYEYALCEECMSDPRVALMLLGSL